MMKRYSVLLLAVAVLGVVSWLVLRRPRSSDTSARTALVLGFRPTVVVDLALIDGIERGVLADAGFDVELRPFGRADLLITQLENGTIDGSLGVPLEPFLAKAAAGSYPVRGYLVWYFDSSTPYDGFVVPRDAEIRSYASLDGMVVGAHPSRQVQYFVGRMLPNSEVRAYNPATPFLGIDSREQAAAFVLEPMVTRAELSHSYRVVGTSLVSSVVFGGRRVPAALSVLTVRWIQEHPEAAGRFVEIAQALYSAAIEDPGIIDRISLLGQRQYGAYPPEVAARVSEPASSLPGAVDLEDLQLFAQTLREGDLAGADVDLTRLLLMSSSSAR